MYLIIIYQFFITPFYIYTLCKGQTLLIFSKICPILNLQGCKIRVALNKNIEKVISEITKEKYENIFKGAYNRTQKYVKKPSNRTRKLKNYLP